MFLTFQKDRRRYLYHPPLLKISGTIAVMSCECELCGSVLKLLNTYLRASTRQERLNGLALMDINYDVEISDDRVMSIFVKKPRALEFSRICPK